MWDLVAWLEVNSFRLEIHFDIVQLLPSYFNFKKKEMVQELY